MAQMIFLRLGSLAGILPFGAYAAASLSTGYDGAEKTGSGGERALQAGLVKATSEGGANKQAIRPMRLRTESSARACLWVYGAGGKRKDLWRVFNRTL